jgi:small subunit ribosomal protein S14
MNIQAADSSAATDGKPSAWINRRPTRKPNPVASKSKIAKAKRKPKFSTRQESRCQLCGRPRAVYRKFGICRICFRKLADQGLIPGVRNASW